MMTLITQFALARYRTFPTRQSLIHWQQKKLSEHLAWVCHHSPYYHAYQGKPIEALPLMNKAKMMANLDAINTRGLVTSELMNVAMQAETSRQFDHSFQGDVTVGLSSGTSGQRGLFLADRKEKQMWAGSILGKLLPGIFQAHRIGLVLRANSPLYKTVAKGPIQFFYADINAPVDQWLPPLDRFQPTLLVGSAQSLQLCARYSGSFGEPRIAPQRIISGAEVLTPADRAYIQKAFSCEVHEVYQCTEGFLACTDSAGQMRWNEDIIYLEKHWLNAEKTHYSPIITDFRRRTQPIIRYQLDDVISAKTDEHPFEPLGAIAGRCGDCLCIENGNQPITVLPDLIYRAVTLAIKERVEYRISQTGKRSIKIESEDHYHEAIQNALIALLSSLQIFGIAFEFASAPDWTPMNKQRRVVNNTCEY